MHAPSLSTSLLRGRRIASLSILAAVAALAIGPKTAWSAETGQPAKPAWRVVCSDAGAGAYEAFPDVCRTKSGELLCVFYAGYGHVSDPRQNLPKGARIAMCRSLDNGQTWSPAEVVADTPIDDRDPSIVALPNGELLVVFMTYDSKRTEGTHQVFSTRSTDNGKVWTEPQPVDTPFTQLEAISTPPRLMPDGRLLLTPYGNHKGDNRGYKHAAVLESRDRGHTWTTLAEVKSSQPFQAGGKPQSLSTLLLEPDLVRLNDDRLLMLCRPAMVWTESRDGGHTWSEPRELGIAGDCPYLLLTSRGVLLCGIRHRDTKSTCVIYSRDQGRTWNGPVTIDNVLGAYPSMVELPDGRILVVYYTEGKGSDIRCLYLKADASGVTVVP
jgi:hypothetical protein